MTYKPPVPPLSEFKPRYCKCGGVAVHSPVPTREVIRAATLRRRATGSLSVVL